MSGTNSANRGRPFGGVYELMDFPQYQFREYPKAVRFRNVETGRQDEQIVADEDEELALLEKHRVPHEEPEEPEGEKVEVVVPTRRGRITKTA